MNICPITYEICPGKYSRKGLNNLSRNINSLKDFPYSADEQLKESAARADKLSIQGVQPKLSARFNPSLEGFELVNRGGTFILKPQNPMYDELPQNEDLTMRLAGISGIEVPLHGLIYCRDGSMTYFIRRFDRTGRRGKVALEDFAQLSGNSRDTKYDSSMEKVAGIINTYCTFPAIENIKLFRLTLFSFLTGNEDMHLKNFSLISRKGIIELSPAYDLINTTIALKTPIEELALPVAGKKNSLTRNILIDYFAGERLTLEQKVIGRVLNEMAGAYPEWEEMIKISFMSQGMKDKYSRLIKERMERLGLIEGCK